METGEGFTSVMDHGVEVSIEHLPKIPCSKFTIIGNSRMRNKKPARKKDQMWRVTRGCRRHQIEREKASKDLEQSLKVKTKSLEPKFGNQKELNRFDKNGIYGDAFRRTLDLTQPEVEQAPAAPRHRESKVEKKFVDDFYRDKSSLFLTQYCKKNEDRDLPKSSHRVSLPSLSKGRTVVSTEVTQSCQGHARLYCDVVGQRYCTACLRIHQLDKLTYQAVEAGKDPYQKSKPKLLATALPKIRRTGSFFERCGVWTDATPNSNSVTRTKSFPLLTPKLSYASRSWERMGDLLENPRGHKDRKRRKLVQRSSMLPKKLVPDITTDTDSRHLNSLQNNV